MLAEQLEQFDAIVVEKLKAELPTERHSVEEHLFLFVVNYTHLVSLLWSGNQKTTTQSYIQYLTEIALEHLFAAAHLSEQDMKTFMAAIEESYGYLDKVKESELDYFYIDSLVISEENVLDPIFRAALMIKALEMKYNLSFLSFFEHYKNWQKEK